MPLPFNHVLVPLDGSKISENAIPFALWIARTASIPLTFLHVVDSDAVRTPEELASADSAFSSYALALAGDTLPPGTTHAVVRQGAAADEILTEAGDGGIIVAATHGRGGFRATFVGSVADRFSRSAHVPVLLIPGTGQPAEPGSGAVLVALDGSLESERVLPLARELAAALRGPVTLLQAVSIPPQVGVEFAYYPPDYLEGIEDAARDYLGKVAREGERTIVALGAAPAAVVSAAQELDAGLVVMASSGKGLAKRLVLGSTTNRVLHSVGRPLLIVPPLSDDAQGS